MLLALMVAVERLVAPVIIVLLLLLDGVMETNQGSREGESSKKIIGEICSLQQGCVTENTNRICSHL